MIGIADIALLLVVLTNMLTLIKSYINDFSESARCEGSVAYVE